MIIIIIIRIIECSIIIIEGEEEEIIEEITINIRGITTTMDFLIKEDIIMIIGENNNQR